MSELQRIADDLARCKRRIAEMQAGTRGAIPESFRHVGAGQAFDNTMRNHLHLRDRLENDFVQAMLVEHKWTAAAVIAAMEQRSV